MHDEYRRTVTGLRVLDRSAGRLRDPTAGRDSLARSLNIAAVLEPGESGESGAHQTQAGADEPSPTCPRHFLRGFPRAEPEEASHSSRRKVAPAALPVSEVRRQPTRWPA